MVEGVQQGPVLVGTFFSGHSHLKKATNCAKVIAQNKQHKILRYESKLLETAYMLISKMCVDNTHCSFSQRNLWHPWSYSTALMLNFNLVFLYAASHHLNSHPTSF